MRQRPSKAGQAARALGSQALVNCLFPWNDRNCGGPWRNR